MEAPRASVAAIRTQIERECEALSHLFHDYARVSSHRMIEAKYQALNGYRHRLAEEIGVQDATKLVNEVYANKMR